ncbi:MAG TPA: YceI family protein [Puia sp.]|jgi:polyisoprenoid-binding protein YceI|nr:YceI family protein [Puia sp.]
MKSFLIISLITITGIFVSDQYKPEDQGSSVLFKIRNLGFNVSGSFSGLDGNIQFDPNNLATCNFDVSIDANTVNTDNNMRDNHLRNETYFDVKNYPRIRFVSTKITTSNKPGVLFIFGKLTIKNQTKDISFPFTATLSNEGYIFNGSFKIKRKDFGVGGTSTISDDLEVSLNILSKKT